MKIVIVASAQDKRWADKLQTTVRVFLRTQWSKDGCVRIFQQQQISSLFDTLDADSMVIAMLSPDFLDSPELSFALTGLMKWRETRPRAFQYILARPCIIPAELAQLTSLAPGHHGEQVAMSSPRAYFAGVDEMLVQVSRQLAAILNPMPTRI